MTSSACNNQSSRVRSKEARRTNQGPPKMRSNSPDFPDFWAQKVPSSTKIEYELVHVTPDVACHATWFHRAARSVNNCLTWCWALFLFFRFFFGCRLRVKSLSVNALCSTPYSLPDPDLTSVSVIDAAVSGILATDDVRDAGLDVSPFDRDRQAGGVRSVTLGDAPSPRGLPLVPPFSFTQI